MAPGLIRDYGCWCQELHVSKNRIANYQSRFLSGCVTEWGESIVKVKRWWIVNHGPLLGLLLLLWTVT